jgi:hypothetical protein
MMQQLNMPASSLVSHAVQSPDTTTALWPKLQQHTAVTGTPWTKHVRSGNASKSKSVVK